VEMSESKVVERYETMKLVGEKDLENENQFLHQIGLKERGDVRLKIYDLIYEKMNI